MITPSMLKIALGVNGQVKCDCGGVTFEVGLAIGGNNNFIRLLECTTCRAQMTVVHKTDAQLAPSLGAGS